MEWSVDTNTTVQVLVEPISTALGPLPNITIRASKLIKAIGFDLPIKQPLALESAQVHSLAPADVLSPHWNAMMNYSGHYQVLSLLLWSVILVLWAV